MLRVVLLLSCVAMASSIALATFAGAILLMCVGFALLAVSAVVYSHNRIRTALGFGALAGVAAIIWLGWIAPSEQGTFVLNKVRDQSMSISESGLVEGDITLRTDLA